MCPVASKETDVQVSWHSVVKGCGVLTVKTMSTGAQRIVWPFTLQCVTSGALPSDDYPKSLELVHGHVLIYSWWLEVYRALHASDSAKLTLLIECALCATVQVKFVKTRSAVLSAAIEAASETWETADVLQTSFHSFAFKLGELIESLPAASRSSQRKMLATLNADYKNLKYQGKSLNQSMLTAAVAIASAFPSGQSGATFLNLFFQWHGTLLCNYSRLYKVTTTVAAYVKDQENADSLQQAGFNPNVRVK